MVACEELKRNWTAFEIEDSYIEIINKRLDEFKTNGFEKTEERGLFLF